MTALGLIAMLVLLLVVVHLAFGHPPDARLGGCDPNDIAQGRATELAGLSTWILVRELLIAAALAAGTFTLLYLQVFHAQTAVIRHTGQALIMLLLAVACALWLKWTVQEWVAANGNTCLAESLVAQPNHLTLTGRVLPIDWWWAVFADTILIAVIGLLAGNVVYRTLRSRI
jgi:hypothetical protein